MSDKYECALCHKIYVKEVSDEEAMAEYRMAFPDRPETDLVILCDDCYKLVMSDENKQN